jgi:DNA polymerase III epsilon subunit-like protein
MRPPHPLATQVHSITDEMLDSAPIAEEIIPAFLQWLGKNNNSNFALDKAIHFM